MTASAEPTMPDRTRERIRALMRKLDSEIGLAWARTEALSDLVRNDLTSDRDDAGVRVLSNQLSLAAVITLSSGGSLEVAAAHHERLAADLDAVSPGEDSRSVLGSARLAHLLAAEICRGDFHRLRLWARSRKGHDYTEDLRLPSE